MKLAAELKKLYIERQKLDILKHENKKQISDYSALITSRVSVNKIRDCNSYICRLRDIIEEKKKNINVIAENVDKIRGELINESQERETLEKLKERKLAAYREELSKEEQKLNDEMVSFRQNMVLAVEG